MNLSTKTVSLDEGRLPFSLSDGRKISVPLAWFPRLLYASPEHRLHSELSRYGLHWDTLGEDIFVAGLLTGTPDLAPCGAAPA